jgi:hypothetical protein
MPAASSEQSSRCRGLNDLKEARFSISISQHSNNNSKSRRSRHDTIYGGHLVRGCKPGREGVIPIYWLATPLNRRGWQNETPCRCRRCQPTMSADSSSVKSVRICSFSADTQLRKTLAGPPRGANRPGLGQSQRNGQTSSPESKTISSKARLYPPGRAGKRMGVSLSLRQVYRTEACIPTLICTRPVRGNCVLGKVG